MLNKLLRLVGIHVHAWQFVEFGDGGYTDQVYKCECGAERRGWHTTPSTISRP